MMKLIKYYKNETFTYWFYSFMPFIILLEVYMYLQGTTSRDPSTITLFSFIILYCKVAGSGLVVFQIFSQIYFLMSLKELSHEMKLGIQDEAINGVKRGRFLLAKDVLIYYGMFSKRVIKRNEISRLKRNKGALETFVPRVGYVKTDYDTTLVCLKNGDLLHIECSIDSLDGIRGELPYNSLIAVVLVGFFILSMLIYPRILDYYAEGTQIERFLFHTSYDVYFWLASIVIVASIGIIAYVLRYIFIPAKKNKANITIAAIALFVVVSFVLGIFYGKREDAMLAREDLRAYYTGEYKVAEGPYKEHGECLNYEVGWNFYEYADRLSLEPVILARPGYRLLFLKAAFDELPEADMRYQVEYLENTKIVVSFTPSYQNEKHY